MTPIVSQLYVGYSRFVLVAVLQTVSLFVLCCALAYAVRSRERGYWRGWADAHDDVEVPKCQ
jgi:hypothetical protein